MSLTSWTVHHRLDRMYVKLFSSILNSSVWSENSDTCKVWITMLALADREGYIFGSESGIARICALPVSTVQDALGRFLSPDPLSSDARREPENEGRRIEVVDGGWRLLNYGHYRDLADSDVRRAQFRASKRRTRGQSTNVNDSPPQSTSVHPSESESNSSSEPEAKKRERERFAPPSLEECKKFFESEKLSGKAEAFFHHFEAVGWRSGRTPLRKWKNAAHTWSEREPEFGGVQTPPQKLAAPKRRPDEVSDERMAEIARENAEDQKNWAEYHRLLASDPPADEAFRTKVIATEKP